MVFGHRYYQSTQKQALTDSSPPKTQIITPNQIRVGRFYFSYPETWIPVFTEPNQDKTTVYFASSGQQVNALIQCSESQNCTDFFKLEISGDLAIWQNKSFEEFMSQVLSEVKLDNFKKTTIDSNEAWWRYKGSQQLNHQTIIKIEGPKASTVKIINASATPTMSKMMVDYVSSLSNAKFGSIELKQANEINPQIGFFITMNSSINTNNFMLVNTLLSSLLAPAGTASNFNYILLTKSRPTLGESVGGPNYPKDDYLNQEYYLLTDNTSLLSGIYGTDQVRIQLNELDNNMGSYFSDPKYCEQNSDCQYRANFCKIGAYNSYHVFIVPWGCGRPILEGLDNYETIAQELNCSEVRIQYDSIACVNKSCQLINPKPACK